MKIGFDAKRAFVNNTGLGHYSRNLLRTLAEHYPENKYVLFTPRDSKREDLSFFKNQSCVDIVTPAAWYEKAVPSLWRSILMSRKLADHGLNIYHGLSHELPYGIESVPVKKVVTIHDLIFLRHPSQYGIIDRNIYKVKFRYACRAADLVIAISEQTRSDLIELFDVPAKKIQVVYQSANPLFSQPVDAQTKDVVREKHGIPKSFILSVGSIIERKNLLNVVKSLSLLQTSLEASLVVVGTGGSYEQQVRTYVRENGLSNRVFFLGRVSQMDLVALYQMADAFVYPSLFEGFGIPIIDALLSGVPVVTSRGSCFSESGGPESLFVDPLNTEELAEALRNVLENDSMRKRMIEKGKEYVKRFDPKILSGQLVQAYERLL